MLSIAPTVLTPATASSIDRMTRTAMLFDIFRFYSIGIALVSMEIILNFLLDNIILFQIFPSFLLFLLLLMFVVSFFAIPIMLLLFQLIVCRAKN